MVLFLIGTLYDSDAHLDACCPFSTSRHSVEVRSMSNLSALTCKSASQSCLRIHLDCLTVLLEQSIWSSRLPQEVQRRSSRWAHTSFRIPLALTMWLSEEPAVSIVSSCGSILAPKKDDGTDFGCTWIQSNGLIALELKCYCRRLVNSCSTSELMQYRAYFWELVRFS